MDTITRNKVLGRDGYRCVGCNTQLNAATAEVHHCLFKSEYRGRDRDEPWNLVTLCHECHQGKNGVHGTNQELRQHLRRQALNLRGNKPAFPKPKQDKQRKTQRRNKYKRDLKKFKDANGGLTPLQAAAKRKREWNERNRR